MHYLINPTQHGMKLLVEATRSKQCLCSDECDRITFFAGFLLFFYLLQMLDTSWYREHELAIMQVAIMMSFPMQRMWLHHDQCTISLYSTSFEDHQTSLPDKTSRLKISLQLEKIKVTALLCVGVVDEPITISRLPASRSVKDPQAKSFKWTQTNQSDSRPTWLVQQARHFQSEQPGGCTAIALLYQLPLD